MVYRTSSITLTGTPGSSNTVMFSTTTQSLLPAEFCARTRNIPGNSSKERVKGRGQYSGRCGQTWYIQPTCRRRSFSTVVYMTPYRAAAGWGIPCDSYRGSGCWLCHLRLSEFQALHWRLWSLRPNYSRDHCRRSSWLVPARNMFRRCLTRAPLFLGETPHLLLSSRLER